MPDFTEQDRELLDRLRKAFESTGQTTTLRAPWQELVSRDTTVAASRALLAAKVLDGFSGSWAAQYQYGWASIVSPVVGGPGEPTSDIDPFGAPIPIRAKSSKIGQRGVPEINFVPFNWRTNTFGLKGPSLVGHPISYEIVGPTLKSPFTSWTWRVEQGAGPNGGDLLTQDVQPDGVPSPIGSIPGDIYGPGMGGIWTIGGVAEPNGGLYVLVSDDGVNPGSLDTGGGQVPMGALLNFLDTARYELFRISSVTAAAIEIHPNKGFSKFFDLPPASTRWIRAITIVHPYATRLAAVPGSGSGLGRERTFVVVSPERSASPDSYPPYDGGNGIGSGDGSWVGGGFTESLAPGSGPTPGEPTMYGGKVRLPIPLPMIEATGTVRSGLGLPPGTEVGLWDVETTVAPFIGPLFASELPLIRVFTTGRNEDLSPIIGFGNPTACLGWFDVISTTVGPFTGVTLGRVAEVNPNLALPYFGPGPFVVKSPGPTQNLGLGFTLHHSVSELWRGSFNLDNVEACRLTNIIDPRWVRRFNKQISDTVAAPPPGASGPGRPDRAIFDTQTAAVPGPLLAAANPGNLMDLGFRMVLFPAKEDPAGAAIPDFDKPITGQDLVIDPTVIEPQYVDIDYSAGIVRLSHVPPIGPGGDVVPNGIIGGGVNNPREEVVLFAACVPYSMEDSQLGTGARITGDLGGTRDTDLYSPQTFAQIDLTDTTFVGVSPFIGPSTFGPVEIVLDRLWFGPETGVINLTSGGDSGLTFGRWGYTQKTVRSLGGFLVTALGGISAFPGNLDPTPIGGQSRGVILRREVVFSTESTSLPSFDGYVIDTAYGSSARATTVRHRNVRLLGEVDGSLTVDPLPDFSLFEHVYGTAMPSKLEYPPGNVAAPTPSGNYLGEAGLLCNLDYQTAAGDPRFPDAGGDYDFQTGQAGIPSLDFTPAAIGTDNWHGVITKGIATPGNDKIRGILHTSDNFRSVSKITIETRAPADTHKFFVGFVQDDDPAIGFLDPTIGDISDIALLFPRFKVIGLAIDQTVDNSINFWTRGSGGDFFVPTGVSFVPGLSIGPFYFVVETRALHNPYNPIAGITLVGGVEVRLGLYDVNMTLISSTTVADADRLPLPRNIGFAGRGLFYSACTRRNFPAASLPTLHFHGTTLVLDNGLNRMGPLPAHR